MTEDALQRQMADFLTRCAPADLYWTAVNPIPGKTRRAAGLSKAMGMKAGVPDLVFCYKGSFVGVEVKMPGKYLSPVQRDAHTAITIAGGAVTTVRSLDDLAAFLKVLGVEMTGRLAA